VIGVLTETAVGDDHAGVTEAIAERTNRFLDHTRVRECSRSLSVLDGGQTEEEHAAEAEPDRLLHRRTQ